MAIEMALPDRVSEQPMKSKGPSLLAIINAQAGGISSAILKAAAGAKLDDFKKAVPDHLKRYDSIADSATRIALSGVKDLVESWLKADATYLMDAWKTGLGLDFGTAYMSLIESYTGYPNLLSMYITEKLDASIRPRLQYYWNSIYKPNIPNSFLAFRMLMEAQISRKEFNEFCLQDGWAPEWHDKLYEVYNREPDSGTAFSMWCKGLIDKTTRDSLYTIEGYDASWHKILTENFYTGFRVYDLARLADFIELDQTWALKKLKAAGMRDEDIAKTWEMLQLRPLREEVRAVQQKWLWRYRYGRCTLNQLKNELIELGVKPKERELLIEKAELDYEDEIVDEWVEVLRWRFRTAIISEDDFKQGLIGLGIREEKANLIVETEKAMGYYGYY